MSLAILVLGAIVLPFLSMLLRRTKLSADGVLKVTAIPLIIIAANADITHLLMSLMFIPHESVTGEMHPTLVLGWSLNFETFFYVVFAGALAVSRKWAPPLCAVVAPLVCELGPCDRDRR